mmetsp:Transcript_15585/g.20304  ORF Transcript_15585/g.20304 Transcript_15585/m.20304 type:complete len:220 (-) Transcript_15585:109-768(-)|eukprot:CAMPEP_0198140848 /NCGR_PEP_ID=MMETSP1443-20131203/3932_1 /TAXON_ID=186043 /ORGANISM="Entomoneis sp., Strain CCMP2396" /LENGTH=219 /DNA_ID=CAMNT_0043803383 /DNA_START=118 /DNA_END=777 /DNA_ORIENTATION=+
MEDEICPDFHTCRNGARCLESTTREGAFVCDCDSIDDLANTYAGISCEHESTRNCNDLDKKSYTSFCTNDGICEEMAPVNGQHQGCKCPDPYTGDFCEYLIGQEIPGHIDPGTSNPPTGSSQSSGSNNSGAIFGVVSVLMIAAVAVAFFFLKRKIRQDGDTKETPPSSTLVLEAGGAGVQKAKNGNQQPDEEEDLKMEPTFEFDEESVASSDNGEGKIV